MKEVSKEKFVKVRQSLIVRARKISGTEGAPYHYSSTFRQSKNYGKQNHWPLKWFVRHFTDKRCTVLRTGDVVTCLLRSPNGRYFIDEHAVGCCQSFELAGEPTTNLAHLYIKNFIGAVKKKYPKMNLSSYEYDTHILDPECPSRSTLRKYFGSWPQVLEAARQYDGKVVHF